MFEGASMAEQESGSVPRATSRMEVPESSIIRKDPHNRSVLYTKHTALGTCSVRCTSTMTRYSQVGSVFHTHGTVTPKNEQRWTVPTKIHCWHCCESFSTPPVPVPHSFDTREQVFVVFGNFCSLSCAKGYIIETSGFDSAQQITIFTKMARDVYKVDNVKHAPSRIALKRFGGHMGLEEFRKNHKVVTLYSAPFVSNVMVFEEEPLEDSTPSVWQNSLHGLRRPENPVHVGGGSSGVNKSPYEDFMKERDKDSANDADMQEEGLTRYIKGGLRSADKGKRSDA